LEREFLRNCEKGDNSLWFGDEKEAPWGIITEHYQRSVCQGMVLTEEISDQYEFLQTCTANNFELMYSRKKNSLKLSPKVHLYVSKVIYDIPARTTRCC
jgi:hypothetical protein